jgi:DNA-binding Lrp family transcriptional regulator
MDAYVFLRIESGRLSDVLAGLASKTAVRRAVAVVGGWDVLVHVEGPDLAAIATQVLYELHRIPGVAQTLTSPVVPPDRVGLEFGGPPVPPMITDACYVQIEAQAGATAGLVERLSELPDVAGVAATAGAYDILVCLAQPWEVASGVIIDQIHDLPGVLRTNTLVSIAYEEPGEDRDQFSSWS